MTTLGKLYLIPVPITEDAPLFGISEFNLQICKVLQHFIAEDAKMARRFLKAFGYAHLPDANIALLNEHTQKGTQSHLLEPLLQGKSVGLMSDAGCPGIADPGAEVVRLAHANGIEVVPLVGPSSIVLSIMASGFNGQNFAFNGYLPVEKPLREKRLRELEQISRKSNQAQFFIETPYRNQQWLESALGCLSAETHVFIGLNIGAQDQFLKAATVAYWKKNAPPHLHKQPCVFGIYAGI